jgi:hypothetical protein
LLILILMAAWRARSQPVEVAEIAKAIEGTVDSSEAAPTDDRSAELATTDDSPLLSIPQPASDQPALLPTPNDESIVNERDQLLRKLAASQSRIEKLEQELQKLDAQPAGEALSVTKNQRHATTEELRKLNSALAQALSERERLNQQLHSTNESLALLKAQMDRINKELQQVAATATKREELPHKVMPIGIRDHTQMIVFRVSNGHVSQVPNEELLLQIKERVQSRRDWLLRYKHLEGQVGPIDGYVARFSIGYEEFDERAQGMGWGQAKLSFVAIEPTRRVSEIEETIDHALSPEGYFRRKLSETPADYVIKIWVPADSFQDYRRLLRFSQQQGFHGAGWPLPVGVPYSYGEGGVSRVAQ